METQIIALEKKYWHGMETHHYQTVKNLTHFPCIIAGKNGVKRVEEPAFKKMFESGQGNRIIVEAIDNIETQLVGQDTAVIAYTIALGDASNPQKPTTKCACSSTWIKQDGNWLCALHTEAELLS